MKLHTQLIAASALTLAMTSAFAAESVTLTVKGTLVAPACTVAEPTAIDFGTINRSELNATGNTALQNKKKDSSVVVTCPSGTAIAIKTSDSNAANKPTDGRSFNFGDGDVSLPSSSYYNLSAEGESIGAYAVKVGSITVDDDVHTINSASPDQDPPAFTDVTAGSNFFTTTAPILKPGAAGAEVKGNNFTFPLSVAANISSIESLPEGDITFEGNATIEVVYL